LAGFDFLAARRRAIRPAAAAPNSRTIGGAGTSVPPLEPPDPPEDDELVDVLPPKLEELVEDELDEYPPEDELLDDEVEDDDELDVDDELELPPPPLDVLTLPDEVDTPPVDVLKPPVDVEVLTPPVDVDTPPDVLDVLEPPELPDEVELLMPPVLVEVDEITTVPPPLPPPLPPTNPPKKPPPKPPPKPPEPPITIGTPLPPSKGASGMKGTAIGGMPWVATVSMVGAHVDVVVVVRAIMRTRFTFRTGASCAIRRALGFFFATFCTCAEGVSATCTAPPPISAPPQVQAHNFAKAMRTDIISTFFAPEKQNVRTRTLVNPSDDPTNAEWSPNLKWINPV